MQPNRIGHAFAKPPVTFNEIRTGAEHVGVVQSLLTTCRLHDIDPYEYLVDVLQRVKTHPPLQMGELTPRRWKELFAQNPKRSVLHLIDQMRKKAD